MHRNVQKSVFEERTPKKRDLSPLSIHDRKNDFSQLERNEKQYRISKSTKKNKALRESEIISGQRQLKDEILSSREKSGPNSQDQACKTNPKRIKPRTNSFDSLYSVK